MPYRRVSAFLCTGAVLSSVSFSVCAKEEKTITAGQNVTLTCRAPNNNNDIVEWSRADLKPDHILVYRDGQFFPDEQHPSFKNRVDLQDRQMKDGDVSVILKDVTINDTGTYKCGVVQSGRGSLTLLSIIYLRVVAPPGPGGGTTEDEEEEDGAVGLIVGLSVGALLLVAAVFGFVIYRNH